MADQGAVIRHLEEEIAKRDRMIRALSRRPRRDRAMVEPDPRVQWAHFPVSDFAMGPGRHLPLPETLEDIAETIGREGALRLSEGLLLQRTGARSSRRHIYIPQKMTADHPMVLILGPEQARALQETHVNMVIEIPRCHEIQRAYRQHVGRQLLAAGETPAEVAACGAGPVADDGEGDVE